MPIKFPNLKSTTEPLGLVEHLGAAITLDPDDDAPTDAMQSWFGRLLNKDDFTWIRIGDEERDELRSSKELAEMYFSKKLCYTVYDSTCLHLVCDKGSSGIVQGEALIKGKLGDAVHNGRYYFGYLIVNLGSQVTAGSETTLHDRWKVKRWVLYKLPDGAKALNIILDRKFDEFLSK